MVLGILQLMLT